MSIPKDLVRDEPGLSDWCILSAYRGSIAHGMYVPGSDPNSIDDKDVMAVCVPPKGYYLGLESYGSRGTKEVKRDEWDIVIYEARKFVSLLMKGNPNVLTMLWVEPTFIMTNLPAGQRLREERGAFVGRHVYKSFAGYAYGQLHRMTHMATDAAYMGAKRRALVEQFGYDTKNAAHLIRLLRMGIEFLNDGELEVLRHDNQQLLEIKRGEWTLDQVKAEAAHQFKRAEAAYDRSKLPARPDPERVNQLCVEVVETAWRSHMAAR